MYVLISKLLVSFQNKYCLNKIVVVSSKRALS